MLRRPDCVSNEAESNERSLANYLLAIVPGAATERLIKHMEYKVVAAGNYIIKQGADDDQIYFIESGQVTAQLEFPDAPPKRLETMQGGRAVGELAFYLGTKRSAAVVADRASSIYCMSKDTLARIEQDDPEAAYAFHRVIIHVLGERVLHLVRAVDALQN